MSHVNHVDSTAGSVLAGQIYAYRFVRVVADVEFVVVGQVVE